MPFRSPQPPAARAQPPAGTGGDGERPDPRRWKALAVCLVGGFMVLLDVSIVNVALPSIRDGLQASESELKWVVSGYALTFGLLLVPAGRVGDVRGRRTRSSSRWPCSRWRRWLAGWHRRA